MKSISEILTETVEAMCSNYCKYPDMPVPEGKNEDWLSEDGSPCETCPLNRL